MIAEILVAFELDLDDARAVALIDIESQGYRSGRNRILLHIHLGIRIAFRCEHFAQYAGRIFCLYGVVNRFFRDADSFFAKFLENI